ncbi:MAG: outer membrane lipoprotein carrier protein LolA [Candidatus Thiodiazotropha sp. (ex Epidulcina cf. delphinae)]|nr:outer membrane lipoprotein carrier protein LolA [Candidatus Thiodiazotropha sp. (ex Epidulcina cf. delphinae)]
MRFLTSPHLPALLACLSLALFSSPPSAEEDSWTLQQLMHQFRQAGERSNRFTETRQLALLDQPIEQSGTLTFVPPDHLIRELSPPSDSRYEIKGKRLTISHGDGKQQTLLLDNLPHLLAFTASLRSVLAGDLATLQTYFTTRFSGNGTHWLLALIPKQPQLAGQVARIEIAGRHRNIDRYTVFETGGDQIITRLIPVRD